MKPSRRWALPSLSLALMLSALILGVRPAPAKDAVANSVAITGTVKVWVDGKEKTGVGVRVVVGKDLNYKTGDSGTDTVSAKPPYETITDDQGQFTISVPAAGQYGILLWKAGFTPQTDTLNAPGSYTGSIAKDNQVASGGHHQQLKVSGAQR